MKLDYFRRSGRSQRMLEAVAAEVTSGRRVDVICGTAYGVSELSSRLRALLHGTIRHGEVKKNGGRARFIAAADELHRRSLATESVFYDHDAIEAKHGDMIAQWLEFANPFLQACPRCGRAIESPPVLCAECSAAPDHEREV